MAWHSRLLIGNYLWGLCLVLVGSITCSMSLHYLYLPGLTLVFLWLPGLQILEDRGLTSTHFHNWTCLSSEFAAVALQSLQISFPRIPTQSRPNTLGKYVLLFSFILSQYPDNSPLQPPSTDPPYPEVGLTLIPKSCTSSMTQHILRM